MVGLTLGFNSANSENWRWYRRMWNLNNGRTYWHRLTVWLWPCRSTYCCCYSTWSGGGIIYVLGVISAFVVTESIYHFVVTENPLNSYIFSPRGIALCEKTISALAVARNCNLQLITAPHLFARPQRISSGWIRGRGFERATKMCRLIRPYQGHFILVCSALSSYRNDSFSGYHLHSPD